MFKKQGKIKAKIKKQIILDSVINVGLDFLGLDNLQIKLGSLHAHPTVTCLGK